MFLVKKNNTVKYTVENVYFESIKKKSMFYNSIRKCIAYV